MTLPITKQIADLHAKSQIELKALWQEYFDEEPPAYRRGFLIKGLAHRIQELTFGGLPEAHQKRLDALVEEKRSPKSAKVHGHLLPGTKLIREWKGVAQHVTVANEGFEYGGRRFRSLSAVAREITGTRWNGWRFFGITNPNICERKSA